MPPKKQEQENTAPYVVWNILPIFFEAQSAYQSLKKPVNIKKSLQLSKIIQLLKQKGIDKYIQQGKLTKQGSLFISQNLQQVASDYLAQLRKPADPKKDVKKDAKKDSKAEVPVQEVQKTIQLNFEKTVTQFLVLLDYPNNPESLRTLSQSNFKIDVVVWVEEVIKESSKLPDYNLLNRQRSIDDFLNEMSSTTPKMTSIKKVNVKTEKKQKMDILKELKRLRLQKIGDLQQTIILQIPYQKDLQHPEEDNLQFISSFFKKLCEITTNRSKFQTWKKQQKIIQMIAPIQQKIKKEVIVEQKKDDKKGGKKDPNAQPQIQIVEQIIEKKYEDLPGNSKSDLSHYKRIARLRKDKSSNIYYQILDNLAISVSQQTQPKLQVEHVNIQQFGLDLFQKRKLKPTNKMSPVSVAQRLPVIYPGQASKYLQSKFNLKSAHNFVNQVNLATLQKKFPGQKSIEIQYKLSLFDKTFKQTEKRLSYSFDDRKFVQKLSGQALNSRVNAEIDLQPKVYLAQSPNDQFKLLILARVNPPGRVYYNNSIFDWKVLPNFEFWQRYFKSEHKDTSYLNYDWRNAGNLKILSKKLMPTDNMIITEQKYVSGDEEHKIIKVEKGQISYHLKSKDNVNVFTKHTPQLHIDAFMHKNQENQDNAIICVREKTFTVCLEETPTVYWKNNDLQLRRYFGSRGEVVKYLKNGMINILYPNGDYSQCKQGVWTTIKDNKKKVAQTQTQTQMRLVERTEGNKKLVIRQDQTIFVYFINGDRSTLFRDGTIFNWINSKHTLQILNGQGIIIRKIFPRTKDINVIGSGSAFAFLGEKDILERTRDGGLYEFHHPNFSWHFFTEQIDRDGAVSQEDVRMMTFRDGSMLKINHQGLLTFLNESQNNHEDILHQRWLQLFTNPEYHSEGVYDVDLIEGAITTKDKQSNLFKLSLQGENEVNIAVSFNIDSSKRESGVQQPGYHVPQENYFLPPPHNFVSPRLFLINYDGSGEQYLNQQQIRYLENYQKNTICTDSGNYLQFFKEDTANCTFYKNSFTQQIQLNNFQIPSILRQDSRKINLIPSSFNNIIFHSIEQISWDRSFTNLHQANSSIIAQRKLYQQELRSLKKEVK